MKKIFHQKNSKGFTLIEMMVSVSIFVIVALIVSGVLVQLSVAYKKAQAMRLLMDNLNFSLEKMNLEIRGGVFVDNPQGEETAIKYSELGNSSNYYCYSLGTLEERQTLLKCQNTCPCQDGSSTKDMLSPSISLEDLNFKVSKDPLSDNVIAKVLIRIKGKATSRPGQTTEFTIQTTATQRTSDPE